MKSLDSNRAKADPRGHSSLPLWIYLGFYVLTSTIGAVLLADQTIFELWSFMFPTMDARWLAPGTTFTYWFVVLAPLAIVPLLSPWFAKLLRRPAVSLARVLSVQPSPLSIVIIAGIMVGYCVVNMMAYGYLSAGLGGESGRSYQENIILRTQMAFSLGELHYAIIYVGLPALAIACLYNAARRARGVWWAIFGGICVVLVWLYMTTLTKGNLVVFGLAVAAAAYHLKLIRLRGLVGFGLLGVAALMFMDFLLSGADPFALARTLLNVIFRESSGIPFYLAVFPEQVPYVGLDVGLSRFGIGPELPANQIIASYMFPRDTWVQSAAPAPAHVMAYGQGGILWSAWTMVMIAAAVGFAAACSRVARSPLAYASFIGVCMACYYTSQTEFAGSFQHSYGYLWWLAALAATLFVERFLRAASATAKQNEPGSSQPRRFGV